MCLIGEYLNERGLTVSAPLLPGHGTTAEQLNRCGWRDWVEHAEETLADLQSRCETVFVGGLSMGSLIAITLAVHHRLGGAVLYSPAVKVMTPLIHLAPVLKYVISQRRKSGKSDLTDPAAERRKWSYEVYPTHAAHELLKLMRHARDLLPQLACPLLVVHSSRDGMIAPDSAQFAYQRAASPDKELVTLHGSGHVLTVDSEWETVAERTFAFIQNHVPGGL